MACGLGRDRDQGTPFQPVCITWMPVPQHQSGFRNGRSPLWIVLDALAFGNLVLQSSLPKSKGLRRRVRPQTLALEFRLTCPVATGSVPADFRFPLVFIHGSTVGPDSRRPDGRAGP